MTQTSEERNMTHEYLLQLVKEDSKGTMYEDILDKVINYELKHYPKAYLKAGISLEKFITEYLHEKHTIIPTEYEETYVNKLYMFIETVSEQFTSDKTAFTICLKMFNPVSMLFMMYNEAYHHISNMSQKNEKISSLINNLIINDFYKVIYDSLSNGRGMEISFSEPTCDERFTKINRLFIEKELGRCFSTASADEILTNHGLTAVNPITNRVQFAVDILNMNNFTVKEFVQCYSRYGSPIPEFALTMNIITSINRHAPIPVNG